MEMALEMFPQVLLFFFDPENRCKFFKNMISLQNPLKIFNIHLETESIYKQSDNNGEECDDAHKNFCPKQYFIVLYRKSIQRDDI